MAVSADDVRANLNEPPEELITDTALSTYIDKWRTIINKRSPDSALDDFKEIAIRDAASYEAAKNLYDSKTVDDISKSMDKEVTISEYRESAKSSLRRVGVSLGSASKPITKSTDWFDV